MKEKTMKRLLSALQSPSIVVLILAISSTIVSPMLEEPELPILPDEIQVIIANKQLQNAVEYIRPIIRLTTLQEHTDIVTSATFSHDGTKLVTASFDRTVKIFGLDAQTGQLRFLQTLQDPVTQEITTHTGHVYFATFSPDDTKLVTASEDKKVKIWGLDAQTGQWLLLQTLQDPATLENTTHMHHVYFATFSPDSTTIATASADDTAKIWGWNEQTGQWLLLQTLQDPAIPQNTTHTNSVHSATFIPNGTKMLTSSWDKKVKIWSLDAQTGKWLLLQTLQDPATPENTTHADRVAYSAFSLDGTKLVTTSYDKRVKIWNTQNWQLIHTLQDPVTQEITTHTGITTSARFNHEGTKLVTTSFDKMVKIWNTQNWQLIHTLQDPTTQENTTHDDAVFFATFSPDDTVIATASADNTAKIWDLQLQRKQQVFTWFRNNLLPEQSAVIDRAYEQKLAGQQLTLTGEDLYRFNTMPEHIRSLLIDYLDIIVPQ